MKPHFWIFFLLFSYNCVVAQSNDVRYQLSWVNADDGLKQLSVRYCVADNYGFVWIATELGLYRYDGSNLMAVGDPRYPSISKQRIVRLGKDKVTDKIYFETSPDDYQYVIDNNQIFKINPKEYWIKAIFTNNDISFSNSNTITSQLLKKINFQKIVRANDSNNFLLACLDSNYLYINYLNRLLVLDKNGKFKDLNFKTTSALFLLQFNDQILALDKSSITLINNGYIVNKHIDFDESIRSYLEREIINQSSLEIFSSGTNYFLKSKGKVYRIDYKNYKLTTHFLFNAPADDISSISYLEKDKVYLVGTRTQGLAVLSPVLFNTLSFFNNTNKSINFCYSVVPTTDDTWYSASGWIFNSKNGKVQVDNFLIDFLNTRFILPYEGNFYVNAKNDFWNIKTKINNSDFGFPKLKKFNSEGFTGYTYYKGQLYLSDANSIYNLKKSVFVTNGTLNKYLTGKSINGLGTVGNSIIIPTSKGVFTYWPDTKKIDIVKDLENVNARYIKPINNESYWVGCYGEGLFLVFQNKAYKVLMDNGVLSTAHAVEGDAKGNFWISTNDGLLRTDKSTLLKKILKNHPVEFYTYTTKDGLLTNEFNGGGTHPSLQTASGIIGFPSMKGFVYFDSNTIPKHNFDGTIVIDQVLVDNRKTIPFLNNTYIVPKEANFITFKFSYGYYFNRDNISIYYRFKNQTSWTKVTGNSIQINRYKKGEQQLIIKISTNGIANHKAVTKKVSVFFEPRYYELAWFWFLIGLSVMILFYFLYLLLFNFQRNRNKYFKSLVDEKTHELNQIVLQLEASKDSVIQTLSEKEILLKEIHHRVKNNLQLVMSLLNIQAQDSKNISIEDFLEKGRSRIATMSLIHQNLYENSSLSKIDFQNYLENLASNILNTFNENSVTIEINTNENDFDVDTAIPLGLIINELLCNSLKHAFKNTKGGIISIHLTKVDAYNFLLEIGDNGVGTTKNSQKKNSIGLDIVSLLVMQLRGTIIAIDKPGTNYIIEFKEANK